MQTSRGLDRLTAFLDAVVAIAITLLVLPLVSLLGNGSPGHELKAVLLDNRDAFASFLLSFLVIASAWLTHHGLLERVASYDMAFLLINLGWVLTVVVLPFSTQVISYYKTSQLSVAIYIGTIALNSTFASALALLVHRRPSLQRGGDEQGEPSPLTSLVGTGTVYAALILGVAIPSVNFYALLLLLIPSPLARLIRLVRAKLGRTPGAGRPPAAPDRP